MWPRRTPPQHTTNKQQSQWQWSSTPIHRVHETQRVYIPQAFLSSSATLSDIAKLQWGESGNENEQTEPDNVADENAVVAQALLNVWKLVGYIPAKKMQKVPDSITHWKQWSSKKLNTVITGHLKNLNMFPHSVSPKLRREMPKR